MHDSIKRDFPLLAEACSHIGSTQIRNRGTIGGNIVNAAPCADSVPPLIIYNASLVLRSKDTERIIPAAEFIESHYKTSIRFDELLVELRIPKMKKKKYYTSYFQLGRRNAVNITRMSISVIISFDEQNKVEECFIVDGSLFSRSQRLPEVEEVLIGRELNNESIDAAVIPLNKKIEAEIGGRWSAEYKQPVFINIFKDALLDIMKQRDEG